MKYDRFSIKKLVRDKMPEVLKNRGIYSSFYSLNPEEFMLALKHKIQEEAEETLNATSREELIYEVADLLEVIDALIKHCDITKEEIEKCKLELSKKKGNFEKALYMEYVDVPPESREYYVKQPQKYPKLST
jgi:predicted house-cleaning noncanonical NTP pyrophosphatase (MazG superfamily)